MPSLTLAGLHNDSVSTLSSVFMFVSWNAYLAAGQAANERAEDGDDAVDDGFDDGDDAVHDGPIQMSADRLADSESCPFGSDGEHT